MHRCSIKEVNQKLMSRGLSLVKKKGYFLVVGDKTKNWRYDRILLKNIGERSLNDWVTLVDKLEDFNKRINQRQTHLDIIRQSLLASLSQDSSSTSHYFSDESEGFWGYARSKADQGE